MATEVDRSPWRWETSQGLWLAHLVASAYVYAALCGVAFIRNEEVDGKPQCGACKEIWEKEHGDDQK